LPFAICITGLVQFPRTDRGSVSVSRTPLAAQLGRGTWFWVSGFGLASIVSGFGFRAWGLGAAHTSNHDLASHELLLRLPFDKVKDPAGDIGRSRRPIEAPELVEVERYHLIHPQTQCRCAPMSIPMHTIPMSDTDTPICNTDAHNTDVRYRYTDIQHGRNRMRVHRYKPGCWLTVEG
jgi:hypothetical protein